MTQKLLFMSTNHATTRFRLLHLRLDLFALCMVCAAPQLENMMAYASQSQAFADQDGGLMSCKRGSSASLPTSRVLPAEKDHNRYHGELKLAICAKMSE